MKIEKIGMVKINKTDAECSAIIIVDKVLKNLQDTCAKNTNLTSQKDGTVIGIGELARVRGILDCLINNSTFEVKTFDN